MPRLDGTLQAIQRWDERACASLNRAIRFRALLHLFRAVSWLGNGVFWYGLMLALLLADGVEAALPVAHMTATGLACTFLYRLLKQGTLRPRPYEVHAHIAAGAVPLDRFSFPSGHTLHAVCFSTIAISAFPVLALPLVPLAVTIALSRVVLGLHYPSDVLVGGLIGAGMAAGAMAVLPA